jgi:hypothetical protein
LARKATKDERKRRRRTTDERRKMKDLHHEGAKNTTGAKRLPVAGG